MNLRSVTFANLRAGIWGAAWSLHPDLPLFAVLGPDLSAVRGAELHADGADPSSEWRIAGEGVELAVIPETAGATDQLVTVRGQASGRELACPGARSQRSDGVEPGRFTLARDVSAWFAPGEGFAMLAMRPKKASGHGGERLEAMLFSGGETESVEEPRLSTTYNAREEPVRATLELWRSEREAENKDEDARSVQYPRRAFGQAAGPGICHAENGWAVQAQPFRWRAEGRDGAGAYLLARAQ